MNTDKMENKEVKVVREVPKEVQNSEFGCRNCLWLCVECKGGSKYNECGHGPCMAYAYYD